MSKAATDIRNAEPRTALVTGAAAGLGRAIADALLARGLRVALADLDAAGLHDAAARDAASTLVLAGDLTAEGAPENAVSATVSKWGRLDVLVNNAGYGVVEPFLQASATSWRRTLEVNVIALALLTAAAGRVMRDADGGRIVNVTSPASRMALPDFAAYAASKAAVDSITRAAAITLAPHGVLVNSIAPGMMDTELQRSTELELARIAGRCDHESFLAERTARVPVGRRAEIAETAEAAVWLALDAPAYMVAERLNLSGGLDRD